MSFVPLGGVNVSLAGNSLAQTRADADRTAQDVKNRERFAAADAHAAEAAGVGTADGEGHETHDRDADGRQAWERADPRKKLSTSPVPPATVATPPVKDPTGIAGNELDLSG